MPRSRAPLCAWLLLLPAVSSAQDRPAAVTPAPQPEFHASSYLGADYTFAYFYGDIDPWHMASFTLGHRASAGSIIARVNYAYRFQTSGVQFEMDAYPHLGPHMYAYLNGGYSGSSIFPEWRAGGELYANLPKAWEASVGFRELWFGGSPVNLLTGSLGKYIGNSWISARPFVRVTDNGISASIGVTGRKYFADADNYIGAHASAGSSPSDQTDPTAIGRTSSWSLGLQGSTALGPKLVGTWSVGAESEQLSATNTRNQLNGSIGIRKDF